jgi:hypothetical protein
VVYKQSSTRQDFNMGRTRDYSRKHYGGDEPLAQWEQELLIAGDSNVKKYLNPSREELIKVICEALAYKGEWYHSQLVLPVYADFGSLEDKAAELGPDYGIHIIHSYEEQIQQPKKGYNQRETNRNVI